MKKAGRSSRRASSLATSLRIMGYKVRGRCPVVFKLYNKPHRYEFDLKLPELGVYILIVGSGNTGEAAARSRGLKKIETAHRAGIGCLYVDADTIFQLQSLDDGVKERAERKLIKLIRDESCRTRRTSREHSRKGRRRPRKPAAHALPLAV